MFHNIMWITYLLVHSFLLKHRLSPTLAPPPTPPNLNPKSGMKHCCCIVSHLNWKHLAGCFERLWQNTGHVRRVYSACMEKNPGHVWRVYWAYGEVLWACMGRYTGHVWRIYWACMEDILGIYREVLWACMGRYTGHVWRIYWACMEDILGIYGGYTGHI